MYQINPLSFSLISTAAMAKPIKLFQHLEIVYRALGIRTSEPELKNRISPKCYFWLISMAIYSTLSLAYFIFKAKYVAELGDTFYIASTSASGIFQIITHIREVLKLRQLNEKFETFFQEGKLEFHGF